MASTFTAFQALMSRWMKMDAGWAFVYMGGQPEACGEKHIWTIIRATANCPSVWLTYCAIAIVCLILYLCPFTCLFTVSIK